MNGIILGKIAVSGLGHGDYWRSGIATLKSGAGDTPLGSFPCATIPGMNEISASGGKREGLASRPFLPVVVPRGFLHFVSLRQLFHVPAG